MKILRAVIEYIQELWYGEVIQVVLHCHPSEVGNMMKVRRQWDASELPCRIVQATKWCDEDGQTVDLEDGIFVITMFYKGHFLQPVTVRTAVAKFNNEELL